MDTMELVCKNRERIYWIIFFVGVVLFIWSCIARVFSWELALSSFPIVASITAAYLWIRLDIWRTKKTIGELADSNKTIETDLISRRADSLVVFALLVVVAIADSFKESPKLDWRAFWGILFMFVPVSNWIARGIERNQLPNKENKSFVKDLATMIENKAGRIQVVSIFITAIATVFMAITSCQSVHISKNVAKIAQESIAISERLTNQDLKRLQAELRPYLIIKLEPGEDEFLRKDGNSQQFFICCYNDSYLILPFKIKNVGKLPAINIKAQYDSPTQHDVSFELGENNISPDSETSETFRPHINIASIVNDDKSEIFEITLKIAYMGNEELDPRVYYSLLKLSIVKRGKDRYDIKGSDFKFGFEQDVKK
ncbi:MAG: hypothetical protein PHP10_04190 [Candidatus Omnitrophica bacterium]|nr:hypothetical protein [Candidatus Omnitrophota bacterium]